MKGIKYYLRTRLECLMTLFDKNDKIVMVKGGHLVKKGVLFKNVLKQYFTYYKNYIFERRKTIE